MTTSSITQTETASATKARLKPQKKIAVLGCGKMGTILLESFLERKLITAQEATATVQHGERSHGLSRELNGVFVGTDNRAAVAGAEIVLLCVKPQVLGQLLEEIAPALDPATLVISIVASTTTSFIQQKLARTFRWSGPCPTRRPWWAPP
ncbi:MAG TPA: NAD(P)-binding domain-containing protein [Candidatus Angelobacter sp.]